MCKITKKSRKKTFTGYKSVVVVRGKYYSPATGVLYKVGPVPVVKNKRVNAEGGYVDMLNPKNKFYNPRMMGKTGVFYTQTQAMQLYPSDAMLKMTISGDLHEGTIADQFRFEADLIVGNHIDKIELV